MNWPLSLITIIFLKAYDISEPCHEKLFRFENNWLSDEGLRSVVEEGWLGVDSGSLLDRILA